MEIISKQCIELTNHQLAIWLESKIHPNSAIHNIGTFVHVDGVPDEGILTQAIENVIQENDAMRLKISKEKASSTQFFTDFKSFSLTVKDFSSSDNSLDQATEWMNEDFVKPLNIDDDELYHIALVKCKENESFIYFKFHHICTDGLSFALMISNISNHYNALLDGELFSNPSSYASYANKCLEAQSVEAEEKSRLYWKTRFQDFERVATFPKKNLLVQNESSERRELSIDKDVVNSISLPETSFEKGLFYFLLATYYITLTRAKGKNELVIGLPLLGRKGPEEMNTLGYFVSVIPLRLSFSNDLTFEELVNGIKAEMRDNYLYRNISIHDINKELGVNISNSTHLYDVVFSFETFKRDFCFGSHKVMHSGTFPSKYEQLPLVLHVQDFNELDNVNFEFDYNLNYLSSREAESLVSRFNNVLKFFLGNTDATIVSAPILFEEEQSALKSFGIGNKVDLVNKSIITPILKKGAEKANQIILTDEEGSLTYAELLNQAKNLAAQLMNIGVESGEAVAVMVPRMKNSIVNILGVLLSGACYVPIDPYLQTGRICAMLNDACVTRIVVYDGWEFHNEYSDFEIIERGKNNSNYQAPNLSEESLAYILFTSGTTGKPKGVKISHGSVLNLIEGLSNEVYLNYSEQGKLALLSSLNFDASVQQLYASLILGRELLIVPTDVRKDGELIMKFFDENEIEISDGIPTHVLSLITRTSSISKNSRLRHLIIGGETFDIDLANKFFKWCGNKNVKVSNVYGPTECTVDSTLFTFSKESIANLSSIPIGRPIQNTSIWVLDENKRLLPLGEKGEICIGGAGLSFGYVNEAKMTQDKFIHHAELCETLYHTGDVGKWDDDGFLYFLGRNDNQVKVRGYRIELAEIEYWLNQIDSVEQSVVLLKKQGQQKTIVGYVQSSDELKDSEIKDKLSRNLPSYMIPHFIQAMKVLPVTATGKIDRNQLLLSDNIENIVEHHPQSATEQKLADIMSEILDLETIDAEASFFSQGGDSLGLVFLLVKVEEEFNTSISMSEFGSMNSVRKIAQFLDSKDEIVQIPISLDEELYDLSVLNLTESENRIQIGNSKAFITGGTGFIGSFLIKEACKSFDKVYCLVRAKDKLAGRERLRSSFETYHLSDIDWNKIVPIPGDLSKDQLGMSQSDWEEVCEVDQIYHSGAMVNFVKDFESMKKANVYSTYNLLILCQTNRPKKFNYISTKGVFTSNAENYFEEDYLENQVHFKDRGYESTKWLADIMANRARSMGIECNIFRLGRITGDSEDGIARFEDFFHRFLEGCIKIKCFPQELLNFTTDLSPVDLTAKSILKLSKKSSNSNFHISNNNFTSYKGIVDTCSVLNNELDIIPYSSWLAEVDGINKKNQENPFFLITPILKQKSWFDVDKNILNSKLTSRIMQDEGIIWPDGNELWHVYVSKCISRVENKLSEIK